MDLLDIKTCRKFNPLFFVPVHVFFLVIIRFSHDFQFRFPPFNISAFPHFAYFTEKTCGDLSGFDNSKYFCNASLGWVKNLPLASWDNIWCSNGECTDDSCCHCKELPSVRVCLVFMPLLNDAAER